MERLITYIHINIYAMTDFSILCFLFLQWTLNVDTHSWSILYYIALLFFFFHIICIFFLLLLYTVNFPLFEVSLLFFLFTQEKNRRKDMWKCFMLELNRINNNQKLVKTTPFECDYIFNDSTHTQDDTSWNSIWEIKVHETNSFVRFQALSWK